MSFNHFTGSFPDAWAEEGILPSLQELWLAQNELTGKLLPRWPAQLWELELSDNCLTGSLPSSGWPIQLHALYVSGNSLSSSIPAGLSTEQTVPELQELTLDSNHLTGTVPAMWPPLLQTLSLANNSFHGSLPERLSSMLQVLQMDFSENMITGVMSSGLLHASCSIKH